MPCVIYATQIKESIYQSNILIEEHKEFQDVFKKMLIHYPNTDHMIAQLTWNKEKTFYLVLFIIFHKMNLSLIEGILMKILQKKLFNILNSLLVPQFYL